MHDVGWPYGRRDLYYAPERIPAEHRQPYAQAGMRPRTRKLVAHGGLNPTMYNAEIEGGPRNGVMTALDDFVAEHDRPLRRLVLPDLLRARHRRRGGAPRATRPSLPPPSTTSRAPKAATSYEGCRGRPPPGDGAPAQRRLRRPRRTGPRPAQIPPRRQGRAARPSTTSRTRSGWRT